MHLVSLATLYGLGIEIRDGFTLYGCFIETLINVTKDYQFDLT